MRMDFAFYPKQASTLLTPLVVEESKFAKKLFLVALMLANNYTSPPMNFLNQDVIQFPAHHWIHLKPDPAHSQHGFSKEETTKKLAALLATTLLKPGLQWTSYFVSKKGWGLIDNLPVIKVFTAVLSHGESLVSINTAGFTVQSRAFFEISLIMQLSPCASFSLRLLSSLQTLISMKLLGILTHCATLSHQFQEAFVKTEAREKGDEGQAGSPTTQGSFFWEN